MKTGNRLTSLTSVKFKLEKARRIDLRDRALLPIGREALARADEPAARRPEASPFQLSGIGREWI